MENYNNKIENQLFDFKDKTNEQSRLHEEVLV